MVTGLLLKEEFGMQLDSIFFNGIIEMFTLCMDREFGVDIKKINQKCKFENRGYFCIEYKYLPKNYKIVIENEIRTYDITIIDDDEASNSLSRIAKFENQLSKESINNAIMILKDVLEKNNFNMYFHQNGKLYKKNTEGIKRVKDLRELQNG